MRTRDAPWGNDLDIGLQAVESELEADLVVALASTSVRDKAAERFEDSTILLNSGKTHSQPSRSATDIMPRAMTGRAREVPRR